MLPKTKLKFVIASLLFFPLILLYVKPALAADVNLLTRDYFLKSSAGSVLSETIVLQNATASEQVVNLSWQGYSLNETNTVSPERTSKHSIDFATVSPTSLTLQPEATGTVTLQMKLPDSLLAGDYYGTLLAQSNGDQDQANFTVRNEGKLTEKIDTTSISDDGKTLSIALANEGNITVAVDTTVQVHDLLWTKYHLTADQASVRANEIKVIKIPHASLKTGFWQEEITFNYGEKKTLFSTFNSFWVNPLLFALPFILILLSATILYFYTTRNHD